MVFRSKEVIKAKKNVKRIIFYFSMDSMRKKIKYRSTKKGNIFWRTIYGKYQRNYNIIKLVNLHTYDLKQGNQFKVVCFFFLISKSSIQTLFDFKSIY